MHYIDRIHKWRPINYSFVHVLIGHTNLVLKEYFFWILPVLTRLVGLISTKTKEHSFGRHLCIPSLVLNLFRCRCSRANLSWETTKHRYFPMNSYNTETYTVLGIITPFGAVLGRPRELPESTNDNRWSRIATTLQLVFLINCNLIKN